MHFAYRLPYFDKERAHQQQRWWSLSLCASGEIRVLDLLTKVDSGHLNRHAYLLQTRSRLSLVLSPSVSPRDAARIELKTNPAMAQLEPHVMVDGINRLRDDLETGSWSQKKSTLARLHEMDLGYRLVISKCG